jgi:hypothetical protein
MASIGVKKSCRECDKLIISASLEATIIQYNGILGGTQPD